MDARSRAPRPGGARSSGQHLLRGRVLAAELVRDACIGRDDLVVEIGAGTGRLTHELARLAGRVVAVELDPAFVERLRRTFAGHPRVEIVRGDILSVALPPRPYRVFGNIPFGATNGILRRLMDDVGGPLARGDLLIQLEAARKRTSVWPGTLLSLGWSPWWELTLTRRIPRHGFEPPPSVDAGMLRIIRRDPPLLPPESRAGYVSLLRRAFDRPTWPVGRAIRDEITPMAWKRFARERGHLPQATPRDLDVADWVALFERADPQRKLAFRLRLRSPCGTLSSMQATLELGRAAAEAVEAPLAAALRGDEASARRYARAWRRAVRELLASQPKLSGSAADVLDHMALTAPFAPGGPVAALVSAAAGIISDMKVPASTGASARLPDRLDYQRFSRVVLQDLSGAGTGLERLLAAWQLSVSDVGRLFGVARQAVQQWLDDGVPPARQPKLLVVLRIADLLERNLLPERVPAVVRTPASAYGDRSIMQAIGADDHQLVLDAVARSFEWSSTA